MFEVGEYYRTADNLKARILGEVNDDGVILLVGYIMCDDDVKPWKWLKGNGQSAHASSPAANLVMPSVLLELSYAEARVIRAICTHHILGSYEGPRKHTNSISDKIAATGVPIGDLPYIAQMGSRLFLQGKPE